MTNCKVTITDSMLKALLKKDEFDTYQEFFMAFENSIRDNQELDNIQFEYVLDGETSIPEYTITIDGYDFKVNRAQDVMYLLLNSEKNIKNIIDNLRDDINQILERVDDLQSEPITNAVEIANSLVNADKLLSILSQHDTDTDSLNKDLLNLLKKFNKQVKLEYEPRKETTINDQPEDHETTSYIYPISRIYEVNENKDGYVLSDNPLNIVRSRIGSAIQEYEAQHPDVKVYLAFEKDNLNNTQTEADLSPSKMGVVGVLYAKVNDKFRRLYIKETVDKYDTKSTFSLTDNIQQAHALGANQSKNFTLTIPKGDSLKAQGVLETTITKINKARDLAKSGVVKMYPFTKLLTTIPKYYYINQEKKYVTLDEFLGTDTNYKFHVVTYKNMKDLKGAPGDVLIEKDGVFIPIIKSTNHTNLKKEVLDLLNFTYASTNDARDVAKYLQDLFFYENEFVTSWFAFKSEGNRVVMYSLLDDADISSKKRLDVLKNDGRLHKRIDPDAYINYVKHLQINFNARLYGNKISTFTIEKGKLKFQQRPIKDIYLENFLTPHTQVQDGKKKVLIQVSNPLFDIDDASDSQGDIEVPTAKQVINNQMPNTVTAITMLNGLVIEKDPNFNLLKIVIELYKNIPGLAERLDQTTIDYDGNYNGVARVDLSKNTIVLGTRATTEKLSDIILHELIHILTTEWINNNPTHPITNRLREIATDLINKGIVKPDQVNSTNVSNNVIELLPWISNPEFRKKIKNLKGIISEIIELARQIFYDVFGISVIPNTQNEKLLHELINTLIDITYLKYAPDAPKKSVTLTTDVNEVVSDSTYEKFRKSGTISKAMQTSIAKKLLSIDATTIDTASLSPRQKEMYEAYEKQIDKKFYALQKTTAPPTQVPSQAPPTTPTTPPAKSSFEDTYFYEGEEAIEQHNNINELFDEYENYKIRNANFVNNFIESLDFFVNSTLIRTRQLFNFLEGDLKSEEFWSSIIEASNEGVVFLESKMSSMDRTSPSYEVYKKQLAIYKFIVDNSIQSKYYFFKYSKIAKLKGDLLFNMESSFVELKEVDEILTQEELGDVDGVNSEEDVEQQGISQESLAATGNDKKFERSGVEQSSLVSAEKAILTFIKMSVFKISVDAYNQKNLIDTTGMALGTYLPVSRDENLGYAVETDENGYPKSVELSLVWNRLQEILANTNSLEEMLELLTYENGMRYNFPEAGQLGNKLRIMIASLNTHEEKLQATKFLTKFFRAFNRYNTPMAIINQKVTGAYTQEDEQESQSLLKIDVNIFQTNTVTPAENYLHTKFIETSEEAPFFKNGVINTQALKDELEKPQKQRETLELLGLRIPEVVRNTTEYKEFESAFIDAIYSHTGTSLSVEYMTDLKKSSTGLFISKWLTLTRKWHEVHPFLMGQMRRNAENEMQSDYSIGSSIMKDVSIMNVAEEKRAIQERIPRLNSFYGNASLAMKRGIGRHISLLNWNGFRKTQNDTVQGKKSINLTPRDYLVQSVISLFKRGIMENIRAQVATTSLSINFNWNKSDYNQSSKTDSKLEYTNLPFSLNDILNYWEGKGPSASMLAQFLNYLVADIKTHNSDLSSSKGSIADGITSEIFDLKSLTYTSLQNLIEEIERFTDFDSPELGMTFGQATREDVYTQTIQNLGEQLKNYFDREGAQVKEEFINEGVYSVLNRDQDFNKIFNIKAVNNLSDESKNNIARAFSIYSWIYKAEEIILFHGDPKQIGKFYKRANSPQSTGYFSDTSDMTLQVIQEELNTNSLSALYGKPLQIGKTFKSGKYPDSIRDITEVTGDREAIKNSILTYNKARNIKMSNAQINEMLDEYMAAYRASNVGDGSAQIHPDAYRALLIMMGTDMKDFDVIYRFNYLKEKQKIQGPLSEVEQSELTKLTERVFSGKIQMPMLKFAYRGPATQGNQTLEVFDKFALVPVFPSLYDNDHPVSKLFKFMTDNNFTYIKSDSGTKLKGLASMGDTYDDFMQKVSNGEIIVEDNTHIQQTEYLKEQIKTSSQVKSSNTLGVQFRELIIASVVDKKHTERWVTNIQKYIGTNKYKVLKRIGFTIEKDGKLTVNEKKLTETLSSLLEEGAESRDLPTPVQEFITKYKTISDTEDAYKFFESSMNADMIETIIASLLKKAVQTKVPGAMFIQISPLFYGEDLKFYSTVVNDKGNIIRVNRAETKITLPRHMYGLLNVAEIIKDPDASTIEQKFNKLNRLLKNPAFREKYAKQLTIVTYRIPTQEYNSMEVFEIVEFLPPWFGPHIVLPPGITTKSGTDFDYDKMSSLLPVLDKNGEITNDRSNIMIQEAANHLLNPINYFRLIKPNSPSDIFRVVEDLFTFMGTSTSEPAAGSVLSFITHYKKWKATKMKDMLGTAAVWNRLFSVMENFDFAINKTYASDFRLVKEKRLYFQAIDNLSASITGMTPKDAFEKGVKHNEVHLQQEPGRILYKWDMLSQFINVLVDASSDDRFGYTNYNSDKLAATLYMVLVKNVPLDRSMHFMHHPAVRLYEKSRAVGMSKVQAFTKVYDALGLTNLKELDITKSSELHNLANILQKYIKPEMVDMPKSSNYKQFTNDMIYSAQVAKNINEASGIVVLAHYIMTMYESQLLFDTQRAINVDDSSNYDVRMYNVGAREAAIAKAKDSKLIDSKFIDRVLGNSTRSQYYITDLLKSVYSVFYPILYNRDIQNIMLKAMQETSKKLNGRKEVQMYQQAFTNDLLLAILHNFGKTHTGKPLRTEIEKYIPKSAFSITEAKAFFSKVNKVKKILGNNLKILNSFQLITLYQKVDGEQEKYYVPSLVLDIDKSTEVKNPIYNDLVFMLNHSDKTVQSLAYDIIYMGMAQSGWKKTRLYFNDMLPESVTTPIIYSALKDFMSLDTATKNDFVRDYERHFKDIYDSQASYVVKRNYTMRNPRFVNGVRKTDKINIDRSSLSTGIRMTFENIDMELPSGELFIPPRLLPSNSVIYNGKLVMLGGNAPYVNHSNGSIGASAYFNEVSSAYVVSNMNYHTQKQLDSVINKRSKSFVKELLENNTQARITVETKHDNFVEQVGNRIGRKAENEDTIMSLSKLWDIISKSNGLYVIVDDFATVGTSDEVDMSNVAGGEAWVVGFAAENLDRLNRPIYIFNQKDSKWYSYNYKKGVFEEYANIPELSTNFTGIGTKNLNADGQKAIENLFTKTFPKAESFKRSTVNRGFTLSTDKKGKDQGKADLATAFIAYANVGTSSYTYWQDAKKQGIPVNNDIEVVPGTTVAFVSVNGNNVATVGQLQSTLKAAKKVIKDGGTIVMDSTDDANSKWNQSGELLVQQKLGKPSGQTSKGYNYWGPDPEQILRTPEINFVGAGVLYNTDIDPINIYAATGENFELSNFAIREFTYEGVLYNSVEHAYQTLKGGVFDEKTYNHNRFKPFVRENINKISVSQVQGPEGSTSFEQKRELLKLLVKISFLQNPMSAQDLLNTGMAQLTQTQDKTIMSVLVPQVLMEIRSEIANEKIPFYNIKIAQDNYTKDTAPDNPEVGFVFTENLEMLGTDKNVSTTQAVIRTDSDGNINANALAVVTKKLQKAGDDAQWQDTDEDFESFKTINRDLINKIAVSGFETIIFPKEMATGKAKLPARFTLWLQNELYNKLGVIADPINSNSGLQILDVVSAPEKQLPGSEDIILPDDCKSNQTRI